MGKYFKFTNWINFNIFVVLSSITKKEEIERSLFGFGNWVTTLGGLIMWHMEIHRWLVHRWWWEGAHYIWDMTWSHMTKVEKIKTRLGLMDRLQWWRTSQDSEATDCEAVKLGQDLAPMDRGNGEERARSRSMDQRGHVMIWSGSYHSRKMIKVLTHEDDQKAWWSLVLVWHQHLGRWNGMRKAKVWLVGYFISPVKGCV